jgi:phosphate transport system permease protein
VTGVVFGVARAAEESAVVLLTTGYSQYLPSIGIGQNSKLLYGIQILPLQAPVGTLSIAVYNGFELPSEQSASSTFSAAFVLIMVILIINFIARVIIRRWKIG